MRSLNRQLLTWFSVSLIGGAIFWNGGALKAQIGPPPTSDAEAALFIEKWSREQAANLFIDFLDLKNGGGNVHWENYSVISAKSRRELGDLLDDVMREVAIQWREKNRTVKTIGTKGKTAVMEVEVTPASPRPIVLVEENGGWTVDVVETYASWNKLQNLSHATALAQLKANIGKPSGDARRSVCMARLSQLGRGFLMYAQDYDEKLPPAREWAYGVRPYVVNERIFKCPSAPTGNSYAYNAKLSAKLPPKAPKSSQFVLAYETANTRNDYGNGENRAYRHQNGANYAFVDGHVKWLPKTTSPDFNLKP